MDILTKVSEVCGYLLPILGVILLVVLIVLVSKILKTLKKADEAIVITKGYLQELDTTVKTINNVSMSVEAVRSTMTRVITKFVNKCSKNYDEIKAAVMNLLEKIFPKNGVTVVDEVKLTKENNTEV